ncbi:hypothetical protein [Luteolibacter luteus]|uniref:Uncharacterized protein n=1 Tax=Luteolibacter luteus TaxID=2728835 RepID=A0A858RNF5_9BACT|nr:hypothetical protein [Luteolibacter luteus]QJE98034.1 hypothetical protein HHL09_20325 [Luteolibacter luteus]
MIFKHLWAFIRSPKTWASLGACAIAIGCLADTLQIKDILSPSSTFQKRTREVDHSSLAASPPRPEESGEGYGGLEFIDTSVTRSGAYTVLTCKDTSTNKAVSQRYEKRLPQGVRSTLLNKAKIPLKNSANAEQIQLAIEESREPLSDLKTKISLGKRLGAKWGLEIQYSIEENPADAKVALERVRKISSPTVRIQITKIDLETGIELWTAECEVEGEKEITPTPEPAMNTLVNLAIIDVVKDFIANNK